MSIQNLVVKRCYFSVSENAGIKLDITAEFDISSRSIVIVDYVDIVDLIICPKVTNVRIL
jgi:hypothetical protein